MSDENRIKQFQDRYKSRPRMTSSFNKTPENPSKVKHQEPVVERMSPDLMKAKLRHHILDIFKSRDPIDDELSLSNLEFRLLRNAHGYLKAELWEVIRDLIAEKIITQDARDQTFYFTYRLKANREEPKVLLSDLPRVSIESEINVELPIVSPNMSQSITTVLSMVEEPGSVKEPFPIPTENYYSKSITISDAELIDFLRPGTQRTVDVQKFLKCSGPTAHKRVMSLERRKVIYRVANRKTWLVDEQISKTIIHKEVINPPSTKISEVSEKISDSDLLDYLRPGTRHTYDVEKFLKCSYPTAMNRLRSLMTSGSISRMGMKLPWLVKVNFQENEVPVSKEIDKGHTEEVFETFEENLSIDCEQGCIILSGLKHHNGKLKITAKEVSSIFALLNRTRLDDLKEQSAVKQN